MTSAYLSTTCSSFLLLLISMTSAEVIPGSDACPTDTCFCFARQVIECTELFLRKVPKFQANVTNVTFAEVDLSENRIRYLGPQSFRNIRVRSVKIWRNIRNINLTMHPKAFHGLQQTLQSVSIRKNSIPRLPIGLFRGFSQLKSVDLSGNRLELIQRGLFGYSREGVEILHLDRNTIQNLEEKVFSNLVDLKVLTLSKNRIGLIDSRAFLGLDKLESLDLRYNQIRDLQPKVFSGLGTLKRLDLGSNVIPALFPVMFEGLKKVEVLTLSNNPIITIARGSFSTMTQLRELRLDKSRLTHLKPGIFDGLSNLNTLFLQESGIRSLSNGLFVGLKSLGKIRLESNQLISLNACSFEFGSNRIRTDVWIKNNPIHCDCSLAWSARYTKAVRVDGLCSSPKSMEGQEIASQGKYHICVRHSGLEDCPQNIISDFVGTKQNWMRIKSIRNNNNNN